MIFDPNFFPFLELARAERFFCGNRAAVLHFSLFWLLLQMFNFLQNKSWFTCLIYLSAKARPMQWFNRSKTIHKIAFLKKLPILDTVMYITWCWLKMKCVYLRVHWGGQQSIAFLSASHSLSTIFLYFIPSAFSLLLI